MFQLEDRISAFEKLGRFMGQVNGRSDAEDLKKINDFFLSGFEECIEEAGLFNNWFTRDNVNHALSTWQEALREENIRDWISRYATDHFENDGSKTIAVIMAGNIPLVGFHDFLSILLSGHKILVKPSGDDSKLLPFLAQVLVALDSRFAGRIVFADGQIKGFDAVVATGSDNSARYFDYYFSKYPSLIRKNRSSVCILEGDEDEETLKKLGEDVFRYFGLGCRNVSKVFVPKGFDRDRLFKAFFEFSEVIENKKYGNNYDYNRAVLMMENEAFLENGFMIIKDSEALQAPVSVLFLEEYDHRQEVLERLKTQSDQIQCIVSNANIEGAIAFGSTQKPALWDYADGVDTIQFLRSV